MQKLQKTLKAIDDRLNALQPSTMDNLIEIVHSTEGAGSYGTHFTIVEYMGYTQGVRVYITGRSKSHVLPTKGRVYSVFNGLDKYIIAGYEIEND